MTDHARECAAAIWLKWGFITRDEATNVISHFIAAAVESETAELRAEVARLQRTNTSLNDRWQRTASCLEAMRRFLGRQYNLRNVPAVECIKDQIRKLAADCREGLTKVRECPAAAQSGERGTT